MQTQANYVSQKFTATATGGKYTVNALQEKLIHGANTAVAANREMTNRKRS
jgi:hypothetical protein